MLLCLWCVGFVDVAEQEGVFYSAKDGVFCEFPEGLFVGGGEGFELLLAVVGKLERGWHIFVTGADELADVAAEDVASGIQPFGEGFVSVLDGIV